jgi:hypothetical protein
MTTDKFDQTTAARSSQPSNEPCEVGISSNVRSELKKINPDLRQRIEDHVARKGG